MKPDNIRHISKSALGTFVDPIVIEAPGRVNLIGEHTDYNGGFVFPMPIPQRTRVELHPRSDGRVRLQTSNLASAPVEYLLGHEAKTGEWSDYWMGVTSILRKENHVISGFEARVSSTVPLGSGLSSSAALLVAAFRSLNYAFNLKLTDIQIALLSQRVENEFVGAHVGIMDPMAIALAHPHHALFIDTQDLSYRHIKVPDEMEIIVINSGISHRNVGGDYNARRAECEKACARLGVRQLRDLSVQDLPRLKELPQVLQKRATHVITENERVLRAVEALEKKNLEELGSLFYESHASMRDDYQVSIPEIDKLVEIASENEAVLGARLTGGGFGGSIVAFTRRGQGHLAAQQIADQYRRVVGAEPTVLVPLN